MVLLKMTKELKLEKVSLIQIIKICKGFMFNAYNFCVRKWCPKMFFNKRTSINWSMEYGPCYIGTYILKPPLDCTLEAAVLQDVKRMPSAYKVRALV